jgi:alanine racemase
VSRQTTARINQSALRHNLSVVRALAPLSQVVSVVKADAYGHGTQHIWPALQETDLFAVATLGEAGILRDGGWEGRLLLLEGFSSTQELDQSRALGAELVVHERRQIEMLQQRPGGQSQRMWLKIDTGMHRLGFPREDARALHARLSNEAGPAVLMTHFACADEPGNPMTSAQIKAFDESVHGIPAPASLANSAGVLSFPDSHRDYVRPGIMLYGISPCPGIRAADIGLRTVMSLSAELIAINDCPAGATVGYGAAWRCPQAMRIGVAAIGYGDGYPRHMRNGAPLLVNNRRAKLAGRVSMDMISIDLRGHDDAMVGDVVTLWSEDLPVEEVAPWADAVPYQLVCGVTRRVRRVEV